jgi:hypothetical protein
MQDEADAQLKWVRENMRDKDLWAEFVRRVANASGPNREMMEMRQQYVAIQAARRGATAMTAKYGNRNVPKMIREIDTLRAAIRAEGTPAIQDAWDTVEQHIDYAYGAQVEGRG